MTYGPEASLIFSNYTGESQGSAVSTTAKVGVRAGLSINGSISNALFIQTGLLYVANGYKESGILATGTVNVNTLELPALFTYKFGAPHTNGFFIGLGPYVAINLSGTEKTTGSYGGGGSSTLLIGSDASTDELKRFDFGFGLNAGYGLITGITISAHYQRGIVNLVPGGNSQNTEYNSNYGIALSYLFGSNSNNNNHSKPKK